MKRYCWFLFLCFFLSMANEPAFGDNIHDHMFFSSQYHYQYIYPHRPDLKEHVSNPARMLEFNLGWQTSGTLDWHRIYNYPSYGLGFAFTDLGNPDVLGEVRSGFLFMEFMFGELRANHRRLKISLGLANFDTYHDPAEVPENRFIGTPWNVHFNLNYQWSWLISDNLRAMPGVSFTHYSNGAYRKPNRGLNILDVNLGLRYRFGDGEFITLSGEDAYVLTYEETQKLFVTYSAGFMERDIGDPTYIARTISINPTIRKKFRTRWGVGLDVFYDDHAKEQMRDKYDDTGYFDYMRIGGFASCDIVFNRLSLLLNLGTYMYYGYEPQNWIYKRVGLRYLTDSGLVGHMALKAHAGRADYVEWGLGYAF